MIQSTNQSLFNSAHLAGNKADQIMACVIDWLKAGKLHVGEKLPTERELAKNFGVSLQTVNKSMSRLEDLGLISRSTGKGTHVSKMPAHDAIAVVCDFEHISSPAHAPSVDALIGQLLMSAHKEGFIPHFMIGFGESLESFQGSLGLESATWNDIKEAILLGRREGLEESFLERGMPSLVIGCAETAAPCVFFDFAEFGKLAAKRLMELKPLKPVVIYNSKPDLPGAYEPLSCMKKRLEEGSFKIDEACFHGCHADAISGQELARSIAGELQAADAIMIFDDNIAQGIASWLKESGVKLKDGVSIACHRNSGAKLAAPPSSEFLCFDTEKVCAEAISLLKELISGKDSVSEKVRRIAPKLERQGPL